MGGALNSLETKTLNKVNVEDKIRDIAIDVHSESLLLFYESDKVEKIEL